MDEDYRIGVSDVLEITIADAEELSCKPRVASNGTFLMPYVGRVSAVNKTPEELRQFIVERLQGKYLKNPIVSVVVTQYNSRSFFIQGSVKSPGVYQIEGRAHLFKLITMAGGLEPTHGSNAFIIREVKSEITEVKSESNTGSAADSAEVRTVGTAGPPESSQQEEPQYEFFTVNINGMYKGISVPHVMIEPGDLVNIPPLDVFFVAGEVNSPGQYPLKEGTTLRQAISLAQGMTFEAASGSATIFREDPKTGKQEEMKVDVKAVMNGKRPDIPIVANDIVMIPNSRLKSVGGTILNAFGLSTLQRGRVR
jgi:polysaccharide export outer membrane protein